MLTALPSPSETPALLDVKAVAQLLNCSKRHIFRLSKAGKMPPPVPVGHLVRWRRAEIEAWLEAGCPARPAAR
ncbi:MAG: helix-turn-helix transcriptional regulator [Gemmataceae bacterium]